LTVGGDAILDSNITPSNQNIVINAFGNIRVNAGRSINTGSGLITLNIDTGGSGNKTLTLLGTLTGSLVNLNGKDLNDKLVGPDVNNIWTLTGANQGTLATAGSSLIMFTGMASLTGGSGVDTFNFNDGATLGGAIDGQNGNNTIDWSKYTTGRNVTLTGVGTLVGFKGTESSIGNGFDNIGTLIGSSTTTDTLTSILPSGTWTINGLSNDKYQEGGSTLAFSNFENFINSGSGSSTFNVSGTFPPGTNIGINRWC